MDASKSTLIACGIAFYPTKKRVEHLLRRVKGVSAGQTASRR